jgi:hypothetical protein
MFWLLLLVILVIIYLFFRKEGFENITVNFNPYTPATSHTVDIPLTTHYSCENKCGPASICEITQGQCTSDIDCQGCMPPFIGPREIYPSINFTSLSYSEISGSDNEIPQL